MDALPPDVRTELVMAAAAFDGHGVTTHRFRSGDTADALLSVLRARWRAEGRTFVESITGDWRVLSARDPDGFTTVQVRAAGAGSEGMVSRWRSDAGVPGGQVAKAAGAVDRWLPPDARVLRRIAHGDPGREAATVIAWMPAAPDQALRVLRAGATRDGFVNDPALGASVGGVGGHRGGNGPGEVVAFQRGREQVVATVSGHRDGAAVVLHWGSVR